MRHRHSRLRLRQKPAHSRLLQRNLVTSVLLYESVRTTKKRALVIRPMIDKLITLAKKKEKVTAIRAINAYVLDKNACRKLMEVLRVRYASRPSGFTRMIPLGARNGDGAEMVKFELVDSVQSEIVDTKPAKKETVKKTPKAKAPKADVQEKTAEPVPSAA